MPVRRMVYYRYSYWIAGFRRIDRTRMPSTRHPLGKALGNRGTGASRRADARPLRWPRKTGLGLVIVAVLTVPAVCKAEELPALIRATTPLAVIGGAGVSSLERLLLIDRNFPGVRLQLAELYRRLNSFEMARSYLAQAEQEPGAGEQARARIQALRADIDRAASGAR